MDFLQEDVDSMQMELSVWKNSYENTKLDLKREEGYVTSMNFIQISFRCLVDKFPLILLFFVTVRGKG